MSPRNDNPEFSLDAMLICIRRELALRRRVYPLWVKSGRMKAEAADHEINCMAAVLATLDALRKPCP